MRNFNKSLASFAIVAAVFCLGLFAQNSRAAQVIGDATTLAALLDDGQIVVGDKWFYNFTAFRTGDMPLFGDVNVVPIVDDNGHFGIRFQGAFIDLPSTPGGSDLLINYVVEALDPRMHITDAHMMGNPTLLGTTGSISVVETFLPELDPQEYRMTIFADEVAGIKATDWVIFDQGYRRLNVQKDILAFAGILPNALGSQEGDNVPPLPTIPGSAVMSFVDQTFSQTEIPEPSTMALMMFSMMGLILCSRRGRNGLRR